jgi:hypothetical protein
MAGSFISTRRRRRGTATGGLVIVVGGLLCFALGFSLFWTLGSRVAGGKGFLASVPALGGSSSIANATPAQAPAARAPSYPVAPRADLRYFRDLSYVPVKAVYMTSYAAGAPKLFNDIVSLADTTEINGVVLDIKDDTGYVTYAADVPMAKELGLIDRRIRNLDAVLTTFRQHGIVPIARIVCFKDPLLPKKRPELAIMNKNGGLWKDAKGVTYVNPYDHRVWEYLVEIAEDAAKRGFREIQFDYVRFPTDGNISNTAYPGKTGLPEDAIAGFLQFARQRLEPYGVWLSADVFGMTLYAKDDGGFGQKIEKVAAAVDVVCPMIYPSHYYAGSYNIPNPNADPYKTITFAMKDATRRMDGTGAITRPWLQDFSMGGVTYGVNEVRAQIKAVEAQGYSEWILWDPNNTYTAGALQPEKS